MTKNVVSRALVIDRVNKWLDKVEEAEVWNTDGGESMGELNLRAVFGDWSDGGDHIHVSVMCVEELAEESLG